MTELQDSALIEISETDLAAILTDHFCVGYTPFKYLRVVTVDQNEGSDMFTLRLDASEAQEAA